MPQPSISIPRPEPENPSLKSAPWTRREWLAVLLLFLIAVGASEVWAALHPSRAVDGTDASQYQQIARNLVAGHGFSLDRGEPFAPTLYREPGYPAFVAVAYWLWGESDDWVAHVQTALVGAIALLTYLLTRQAAGWRTAFMSGLLVALSLDLAELARQLLSEVLFTLLLLGAVLATVLARQRRTAPWFALAGTLFGLAVLVRAQSLLLAGLLGLVWLLAEWRSWQRTGRYLVFMGLCTALVVAPWLARNALLLGTPSLTARHGVNLLRRAPKAAYPPETMLTWARAATWMATYPLSALVVPFGAFRYGGAYYEHELWDFHVNDSARLLQRYDPICRVAPNWDTCGMEISWGFVREYPVPYLAQTAFEVVKLNFKPLPGGLAVLRSLLVWLCLASVVGLWRAGRLRRGLGWVFTTIVLFNAVVVPFDTQERYGVPALPLYAVLAASGLALVAERSRALRERWRANARTGLASNHVQET